jgi:hypothetical protein
MAAFFIRQVLVSPSPLFGAVHMILEVNLNVSHMAKKRPQLSWIQNT